MKEIENSKEERKLPFWTIFSLILISVLITGLIICTFLLSDQKFIITESIIILLCLLAVLILSNSFDYIHFGKYFELSKRVKEGNEKITQLKESSDALYQKIMNMNIQNTQASTVNNNFYQVKEADSKTLQKERVEEEININKDNTSNKRLDTKLFRNMTMDKFFGTGLKDKLKKNMSLVESVENLDQISNKPVNFDALLEEDSKKVFIEILPVHNFIVYYDRLYVKLNKILSYKRANNVNASILVLIPRNKESENNYKDAHLEQYFAPAIENQLLQIEYVGYDKKDYESCLVEIRRRAN